MFIFSVEFNMARHLCQRVQRGFVYSDLNDLWPREKKTLVLSGGVGCNKRIRSALKKVPVCYEFFCLGRNIKAYLHVQFQAAISH